MATTTTNTKLRHNEYYVQQSTFDELYERSLHGANIDTTLARYLRQFEAV